MRRKIQRRKRKTLHVLPLVGTVRRGLDSEMGRNDIRGFESEKVKYKTEDIIFIRGLTQ